MRLVEQKGRGAFCELKYVVWQGEMCYLKIRNYQFHGYLSTFQPFSFLKLVPLRAKHTK